MSVIAKQFRRLEALGCIEQVGTRKSGRTFERIFNVAPGPVIDKGAWETLSEEYKRGITARGFSSYLDRVTQAADAGTITAGRGRQFTWTYLTYDERAWTEAVKAVEALFWWSVDVWTVAERRLARSGGNPIALTTSGGLVEAPSEEAPTRLQSAPFFVEEEGEILFDPNLAAGLTHKLRIKIFAALSKSPMSPKEFHARFGAGLGVSLSKVSQHFRRLEELGCVELLSVRAGAHKSRERVFRAVPRSLYDGASWMPAPPSIQLELTSLAITTYIEAFAAAAAADTVDRRGDSHLSWVGMRVDERAWREINSAQSAVLVYLERLEEEARSRLDDASGRQAVPVLVSFSCFESPRGAETSPEATLRKLERELRPDRAAVRRLLRSIGSW
ncbi:MAG: winged helix-turn-helix domain-containing protein [Solirubrobacterales bacterium]